MNRCVVTKWIIQGVAGTFGVLGLMLVFMGFCGAVASVDEVDRPALFYTSLSSLVLGGIAVAIAWMSLRHFGPGTIPHITALVAVSVYLWLLSWLFPLMERLERTTTDPMVELLFAVVDLLLMVLMYWSYRALSRKLIQLAGLENGERGDPALLSDAASDASSERE